MSTIPLGISDWKRPDAKATGNRVLNRFFEKTPDPEHGPVSFIARPGLRRFVSVGEGPIRATFSEPGTFGDDLFAVSGNFLWRITRYGQTDNKGAISNGGLGFVSMASTPLLGTTPEYLFLTEGGVLWLYTENGEATGQLEATGPISNGDTVVIDGVYYQFTNTGVDTGSPDGSSSNPWLVNFVGNNDTDLRALFDAINDSGTAGTDYSTTLTANTNVRAHAVAANDLYVSAREVGTAGNTIAVSETGVNLAWTSATLEGGGTDQLRQVPTPDDVGIVSVGYIAGYVICVVAQGEGLNGRFYWIDPGTREIDPLDFATAERSPDPAWSVRTVGDQFWLLGASTVEPWYLTGQGAAPFARQQARVFDRGVWQGTDVQVKDEVVIVDNTDGRVYALGGQGPRPISDSSIEERIRKAMAKQG